MILVSVMMTRLADIPVVRSASARLGIAPAPAAPSNTQSICVSGPLLGYCEIRTMTDPTVGVHVVEKPDLWSAVSTVGLVTVNRAGNASMLDNAGAVPPVAESVSTASAAYCSPA